VLLTYDIFCNPDHSQLYQVTTMMGHGCHWVMFDRLVLAFPTLPSVFKSFKLTLKIMDFICLEKSE
jgi:hypothetical protein